MINSSYNRSSIDANYANNNYAKKQPSDSIVKDNEINAKSTKVSEEQAHLNKVEQIKNQIANGSYKVQDSKTLAAKFIDAEFS